jgi:ABC-type transport system involved in multi-copper enzyme maturation permease subunit
LKALALALAVIFFIVAILYLLGILQIGASHPGRHISHAVLFAVLGVLSLIWMRFQSAAPSTRP